MIAKGVHASAVIEIQGQGSVPDSLILEPHAVIYVGKLGKFECGKNVTIYPQASIRIDRGALTLGDEVSLGPGVHIYEPRGGISIGSYTMIGGGTVMCGVNHGFASMDHPMREQPANEKPIVIGKDVWIGMNVTIMPGVTIGDHAIIGAGSLVTKDVPAKSISYGSPCGIKRYRE